MVKKKHIPWDEARASADRLQRAIEGVHPNLMTEFAGSLRRRDPMVGDLDLLVEGELDLLRRVPGLMWVSGGAEKATMEWEGRQLDAWRVRPGTWGSTLFGVTGPTHYFIWYAKKAIAKGWKLSIHGLHDGKGNLIAAADEHDIYRALDKDWKEPSKRGK